MYHALIQIYALNEKLLSPELKDKVKHYPQFKIEDFEYIKLYLEIMKPLADTLDRLQGEKQCFYGCLLPNLIMLKRSLISLADKMTDSFTEIVQLLINFLEKRFHPFFAIEGNGEIAAIAALSHPYFKSSWLHCLSIEAQENVSLILRKFLSEIEVHTEPCIVPTDSTFNFGQPTNETSLSRMINQSVEYNEFLTYLKSPCTNEFTCLNNFPLIKKIFLKYNKILPSSAPVERLFSYATLLDLPKYNRLSDDKFEKRILLKINLKIM